MQYGESKPCPGDSEPPLPEQIDAARQNYWRASLEKSGMIKAAQ
jgi:hypothetical protein